MTASKGERLNRGVNGKCIKPAPKAWNYTAPEP